MNERDFQLLRTGAFLAAVGLAATLQRLRPHARRHGSVRTNVALWTVNAIVMGTVCGACACTVARWAAQVRFGILNVLAGPLWVAIPTTVVGLDAVSYLWHRANHTIPALWRFHAVHHSDQSFTVSTALRFHPGELLLSLPIRLAAVLLLGAPPEAVVVFEGIFAVANTFEHGDIDLAAAVERVVGRVFVTPALHRFHHIRVPVERDHNFGTVFVLWDRWLGTYRPNASAVRIDVGLRELPDAVGFGTALLLPVTLGRA